jgi:4-oxalocrotonate tautomerase
MLPHVIVNLWPGKSERQKTQLAAEITRCVTDTLDYGPESVSVAFEEIAAKDWASKVDHVDIVGDEDNLYKRPGYTMPD